MRRDPAPRPIAGQQSLAPDRGFRYILAATQGKGA
jgi:hypothetical protein